MAASLQESHRKYDTNKSGKVKVTFLASEWGSSKDDLSTISRHLAIELAKSSDVEISFFVPQCSEESKTEALRHNIIIVEATQMVGYEELDLLSFPPDDLQIEVVVGYGVKLGRQVQAIRRSHQCKWVQVVHTDPEEMGMFKCYQDSICLGEEKRKDEVKLCEKADFVVGIGPKLAEIFRSYLRYCKNDEIIFDFTPGIFEEFLTVKQAPKERNHRSVLVFGCGDIEDFKLKGFDIAGKAIASLADTRLVFVGAPKEKHEEVKESFMRCGVPANRLRVRGYDKSRESLKLLFCEVDLLLMPSRTDGFELTGVEALSAGLPVLASKNSGFGEALYKVPLCSAFVIDSDIPDIWTAAIKNIMWDKNRQCRLEEAENVRILYGTKYSWTKQSDALRSKIIKLARASLQIQIDGVPIAEGSGQKGTGTEVHSREPQEVSHGVDTGFTTENCGNESDQSREAVLDEIVRYLRNVNPEELNNFIHILQEVLKLKILQLRRDSIIITVEVCSEEILEELWQDYQKGHLNEMAQKFLVTEQLLEKFGLIEFKLTTFIAEEEYKACQRYFSDTVPDSEKGQPTSSLDHPSVSGDRTNIKRAVEDLEKGQPTSSLDHLSVSGDATNIKRSVEATCVDEPAISCNRPRQFERGESAEFGTRNISKLPPLTERFTGREEVVEEIVSKLTQPKPFRMVVLLSIPGAGKTQAAIKVGHDLLKYNKSLLFIEKQETLEQLCTEIIRAISGWYISGSDDLVCIAKEKLKAVGSDVCIILDNTEDIQEKEREEFDSFVNFVVQEAPAIQLIITSQEDVGCTSLNVHKKFLLPLDPQSCALLLQGSVPITEEKAQEIGKLCGGIPLLLVPCVALLQKSFSPEALIQWLKEDPIPFLRDKAENVYNALGKFLRKMPNSLLKNLIKLSVYPASFSVKDISEIHFNDEQESETVKTTMVGCSLLQRMGDGMYALHPLVREYCRANRKDLGMDEVGKSAQDKFNEHFIEKLMTLSKEFITKDSAMAAVSSFRKYRANIMEALRNYMYLDEKSSTDKRAFGVDVAISTEVLDFLCKVLLPPAECLKFYRRCYDIAEGSGDQRRLANSLNALGFRYLCDVAHLKPNQPSLDMFKEAKGIYEKLSKEQQNCQAYAHILCKLGLCFCLKGEEKEEGLELIHEGIALKEKLGDPLYLAAGYCDLGNAYCTLGDHQRAIDIWEKETLPIYRNQLGEHPWTATILDFIALSYKALAKTNVDGAVENSRNSLKLRKKLLGFHQDTARSHVLLSDVLVEVQNDFKSGLKELEQALEIQKEVLGENHSSTTETKAKMMRITRMQDSN